MYDSRCATGIGRLWIPDYREDSTTKIVTYFEMLWQQNHSFSPFSRVAGVMLAFYHWHSGSSKATTETIVLYLLYKISETQPA